MKPEEMSIEALRAVDLALHLAIAAGVAAEKAGVPFTAALDFDGEAATVTFSIEVGE